jgi:hypothetical protein
VIETPTRNRRWRLIWAQQRGAGATSELERDPSPLWRALDEAIN